MAVYLLSQGFSNPPTRPLWWVCLFMCFLG
jgi:hypothetical protein